MDPEPLRERLTGRVVTRADHDFDAIAFDGLWNRRHPRDRAPEVIARVADEQDVVEAVNFARASGLRVAVRGGGHNWCSPSLRAGGLMIDLTALNQVVSIDVEARTAVTQPIVSNRELQAVLNGHGLAYPTGHCPQVKMSGYLLSGGMAWNPGVWGEGFASVEAIELVTPQGELITASEDQHVDYFWAARGAGSGLFAVAVRYHLRLHPLPRAIWTRSYHFALEQADAVGDWLGSISAEVSSAVELTLFLLDAPPELADRCESANGKLSMVTATAFCDSEAEARTALEPLAAPPVDPLAESAPERTDFPALFDLSGSMWPEGLRSQVDAQYFDGSPADVVSATRRHFEGAPSPRTLLLFAIPTGSPAPAPDAAYSMHGKLYGGPWTMWTEPPDDVPNLEWHAGCVDLLKPHRVGHYVGESDTVGHPEFAQGAFSPDNWRRLEELRSRHDPDGLFFGWTDGL